MATHTLPVRLNPSSHSDGDWVDLNDGQHAPTVAATAESESMTERIQRVSFDEKNLFKFYNIKFSPTRYHRLKKYYSEELDDLFKAPFDTYDQEDKVDFLLLRNYLRRNLRVLELDRQRDEQVRPVLPFTQTIIDMVEDRQRLVPVDSKQTAMILNNTTKKVQETTKAILSNDIKANESTFARAMSTVDQLRGHVDELYGFYSPYDPLFPWWNEAPKKSFDEALTGIKAALEAKLNEKTGPGSIRAAVEPIGRDGLLNELEAEMIPYTPEELLKLAKEQYDWCEREMKKASRSIKRDQVGSIGPDATVSADQAGDASTGFGDNWKAALEYVKNSYVEPGQQPELVRQLAREGEDFVTKHDLVTVPSVAAETWRMFMISAERQKESPFFLGGPSILVSYPTVEMDHDLKMMVMRGNNPHFSRATAFHELIPGHRLQLFMAKRHHPYRKLFETPFFVEGWAMYWEFVFWNRGDFFVSPEDKIGTLFWRMHRCARIIFSLKYHLGEMTPQECVDLLVDWVGHERSNAEGEVTRSFGGEYSPLYQAGYMLGAFQMYGLREEALMKGLMGEKELHDKILRANTMPIELLRALVLNKPLTPDYTAKWRFYDSVLRPTSRGPNYQKPAICGSVVQCLVMDNGAELGHQGEATDAAHDDSGGASEAAAALACNCCRRPLRVVLHAMVLAASRYIADEDTATTAFGAPQQRVMARDWVVSQAVKHLTVESLQALIIVAFNDIGSGEAAQAWSLVGSLTRTVEYLQLTIEHDDAERLSLSQPFVSLPPPDNWTEAEERRRVFWNVFKLDRLISVTMGWNTSLTSDDVHCRLPCDGVLWRKEDRVVTPYFGIWDKAAGRIGNPIAFIPSHYAQTSQITAEEETQTPSEAGTSPGAQIPSVDMSTVGAFAYCIEATESLSRVTSYFLQQKVNMRDQRDISSWLTRFKELDLRLVHWKMLLPQKWKANMARQSTRMDPNLTLAHVTHNTSMILLHQLIAFPPREWAFRARLPSILSIDTCQAAAVEIAIIAENYLKHAPPTMPVSSQFAFCIYVAARVLLLRWKYDLGGELVPEFWSLVQILDEMAGRWAGPHSLEPARDNLAGKYSRKLTEMHSRCREDASYNINVLGYTTEIDHTSSKVPPVFPQPARNGAANQTASNQRLNNARVDPNLLPATEPRQGMAPNADSIVVAQQFAPPVVNPNPNSGGIVVHPAMEMNGVETMTQSNVFHRSSVGSGELSNISQMLLDQQFVDMDRIISFDDGIFGTEYEGGGW
ncbi:hypothetical protein K4K56_012992 [Colletotrichum sp. SAR 10_98]|nr:hypothetical protein K4K56_012992 [Colletotrichum sp. SAR 10_98]